MSNENKVWRWGIIGCGKISSDWCNVLLNDDRCIIQSCAARSLASAQKFAKKFDIPIENAYDSYETLAKDPNVDIIYIGTIHPNHRSSSLLGLNNGKHILCEKPVTMNNQELQEVLDCARKHGLFYMEGMWTRFFPAIKQVREWVNSGTIGDVITVDCNFGFKMPSPKVAPRLWDNKLGGGLLLDIGIYPVSALEMIFGPQLPKEMKCIGTVKNGVDSMIACTIKYNNIQYGTINGTFYAKTSNELNIIGNKGRIKVHNTFHAPKQISLTLNDGTVITKNYPLPNGFRYPMNFVNSEGFAYQCNEVIKCLNEGRIESPLNTWKDTQISMQIMDEIRQQIGLTYDADKIKSKL